VSKKNRVQVTRDKKNLFIYYFFLKQTYEH
jgi:hypothetical protein